MNSGVPSGAPGAEVARIGNYVLGQTIGAGSSASVRLATHRKTNAQVAVKIISKRAAADSLVKKIAREAPIMRLLRHVNIVRLYDVIDTTEYLYLVTEYAAGGELFDHLIVHGKMSETQARDVFRQIVSAVQYCHSRKIVHRDLKAENILFDSQMNVKLIDFGFSRQCDIDDALTSFCGTPIYAAPELLQRKPYSGPRADAWSLGILLYVMLTGAYPFAGTTLPLIRKQAIVGDFDIPSYLSVDCARLVMGLLEPNAEQRLTLEEVMTSDPWFTDHSKRLMKVAAATPRTSNSFLECLVRWETARKMRALGYVDAEITVAMELSSASEAAATYHLIADTFREQVNDPSILMCAAEAYQAEQREAKLLAQQQQQQQHQQQQQQQQQTGSSNSASRVASRSVSNVSSVAIGAVNNNGEPVYMNLLTVPGSSVSGGVPVGLLVDDVTTSSSSDVHSATPQSPTHLTSPTSVQSNMTGLSSVASMRSNASSMIPEDAETRRQRTLQKIEVPTFLIKDDETGEGVDSRESDDEENAEEVLVPKRGGSAGPAHSDENPTTVFTPPASKSTSREENDAAAAGTRGGKSVLVRKRSNSSPNTSGSDISLGLGSVPTTVASPGRPRRPSAGTTHAPHPYTTHDSTRLSMEDRKRRQRSSKSTDHTPHSPPLSPLLHLALHHSISQERLAAEILTLESAPPSVPTSPRKLSDPSSEHDVLSVDNTTRNMDAGMASVSCSSTSATAAEPPSSSFAVLSPSTSNTNATPRTVNAPRGEPQQANVAASNASVATMTMSTTSTSAASVQSSPSSPTPAPIMATSNSSLPAIVSLKAQRPGSSVLRAAAATATAIAGLEHSRAAESSASESESSPSAQRKGLFKKLRKKLAFKGSKSRIREVDDGTTVVHSLDERALRKNQEPTSADVVAEEALAHGYSLDERMLGPVRHDVSQQGASNRSSRRKSVAASQEPKAEGARFAMSRVTVSSKDRAVLLESMKSACDHYEVPYDIMEKPYTLRCVKNIAGIDHTWEMEIALVPNMRGVSGVKFRRMGGNSANYKSLCQRIVAAMDM